MMRLICQRLYKATSHIGVKTTGHNLHNLLLLYKNKNIDAGTLND